MPPSGAQLSKWNAADYAANSDLQKSWAEELLAELVFLGEERVLDVGCGDGKITAGLARRLPRGSIVGVDAAAEMTVFAQENFPASEFPNLSFQVMDARRLGFDGVFDLVFSNAALHWVEGHEEFVRGAASVLKPGGRLLVSCGGKGNAQDVFLALRSELRRSRWRVFFRGLAAPYFFYSLADYEGWLLRCGFRIEKLQIAPQEGLFEGLPAFAAWLRTTWMPYTQRVPEALRQEFIDAVAARYLARHQPDSSGRVRVRMVRLEINAVKI